MARKPRFNLSGMPQHVIHRGNDRQACFSSTDACQLYLDYLKESAERYTCSVHAYVLMTNHVHLLITPRSEFGVSHMMQRVGQRYVQTINWRYHRTGTLWEGRYKASLVQTEQYLLTLMRYIELNPVRACMVENPADYVWSSYRHNGHVGANTLIDPHPLYLALGSDVATRCEAYRALFAAHMETSLLNTIRDALNKELVLGDERFRKQIEIQTNRQTTPGRLGRPTRDSDVGVY